jgi:hypothetical protein
MPLPTFLRRLWAWWEPIARAIGNAQARLLLYVIYFVVVAPIALVMRLARGRFGATGGAGGFWTSRPTSDHSMTAARRQA